MRIGTRLLMMVVALARLMSAQTTATPAHRPGATISGAIRDSLANRPLADAVVQLADADPKGSYARSTTADSLGRFTFRDVPDGHYLIGFLHPALDSLGLEEPAREVYVRDGRNVRIDLALPSALRLRAAICPNAAKSDSTGIVVGFVRNAANSEPIAGAKVTGEWAEFTLTRVGLTRTVPRLVATTAPNGWFALCGVPAGGTMAINAAHAADTTAVIEVEVSAEGFAHRDLYLGPARASIVMDSTVRSVAADDSTARHDSITSVPRLVRTGVGRLTGTVHRSPGDAPLAGAQVTVLDGPQTRADDRGVWTISDAPLGSRMLEVRAVGYYPERRAVDIVAETPPIQSTLSTLKSVLDTVRVHATTLYARDRNGFQQRQRSGQGRYITPDDVERRHPVYLTDLLRTMPGVYLQMTGDSFSRQLMMRGTGVGFCTPTVYLDGMPMFSLSADDLDAAVQPADIAGVEVYSSTTVPPQFQRAFSGCGSVVVWTR